MRDGHGTTGISRRAFLRLAGISVMGCAGAGVLAGCAGNGQSAGGDASSAAEGAATMNATQTVNVGKALVVYFSRTGENYDVGTITTGNTAIIAGLVADKVGADSFEIKTVAAYPDSYDSCCDVARDEQSQAARPALEGTLPSLGDYDAIFVGYPNWWGDMPMALYSFIEANAWDGRTVLPFCTHAGSGLSDTVSTLGSACVGAQMLDGLAVLGKTAQNDRDAAEKAVGSWLEGLGIA